MPRYIDIDKFENYYSSCIHYIRQECEGNCAICYCDHGGAEDVTPVIHAKIIRAKYTGVPICTNCKEICYTNVNYCYNCGAKLDKE